MPAKPKSPSKPSSPAPTSAPAKRTEAQGAASKGKEEQQPPTEVPNPRPSISSQRESALNLFEEKPKRRRNKVTEEAPVQLPPEPPKPSALDEKKMAALSLFDEGERKAQKRKVRTASDAPGESTKPNILPAISRRLQEKQEKLDADKAALTAILEKAAQPHVEEPALKEAPPAPVAEQPVGEPEADSKIIQIKPPIIVREIAERMGLKAFKLIGELMAMDIFVNQNQAIEPDVAAKICEKHGFIFEREKREKGAGVHKVEEVIVEPPPPTEEKVDELLPRPPIITMMGHVDHGKTSLLDAIRKTRVASGEAGGITQHIGAYSVEHNGGRITFLDTPGHAAFTAMRARGAQITDIVILVVAADDGLMPQTLEAIAHAKAAKVKIVVALNKIDKPQADPNRVMAQLQENDLSPEEWGGTTCVIPVSAVTGQGIDKLLETALLEAELLELKANPKAPCRGIVVESRVEPGKGPTASVIPQTGTLKIGASFICGPYYGKVKNMLNDHNKQVKEAGPAFPVEVIGFSNLPNVGDELVEMDEREAKRLSEQRQQELRMEKLAAPKRATLENLFASLNEGDKQVLKVILKTDVQGSLEALQGQLAEIQSNKINLEVIHGQVGPITENDVILASASDAIIIGFNTKVEGKAVKTARAESVQVKLYSIIYELIDQVKEAMLGMLAPETREKVVGHAQVKQIFKISRGRVAGCVVTDGRITRKARARVLRGKQPVYDGGFHTLRRFQDDVDEVRNGLECGIRLGEFNEYEPGDIIECYELEKFAQTL